MIILSIVCHLSAFLSVTRVYSDKAAEGLCCFSLKKVAKHLTLNAYHDTFYNEIRSGLKIG